MGLDVLEALASARWGRLHSRRLVTLARLREIGDTRKCDLSFYNVSLCAGCVLAVFAETHLASVPVTPWFMNSMMLGLVLLPPDHDALAEPTVSGVACALV